MRQNSPAVGSYLILALAVWVVEAHKSRRGNYYASCRRITPPFAHHHNHEWETLPATQNEGDFPFAICRNSVARFGVVLHQGHTTREAWHASLAALRKIDTVVKLRAHRLHVTRDGLVYRVLSAQKVAGGREVLRLRQLRGLSTARNVTAEWQMEIDIPVERRKFEEAWLGINSAANELEDEQGEMELAQHFATEEHTCADVESPIIDGEIIAEDESPVSDTEILARLAVHNTPVCERDVFLDASGELQVVAMVGDGQVLLEGETELRRADDIRPFIAAMQTSEKLSSLFPEDLARVKITQGFHRPADDSVWSSGHTLPQKQYLSYSTHLRERGIRLATQEAEAEQRAKEGRPLDKRSHKRWRSELYQIAQEACISGPAFKKLITHCKTGLSCHATRENSPLCHAPTTLHYLKAECTKDASIGSSTPQTRIEIPSRCPSASMASYPVFLRDVMETICDLLHNPAVRQSDIFLEVTEKTDTAGRVYGHQTNADAAIEQIRAAREALSADAEGYVTCQDGKRRKLYLILVNSCIDKSNRKSVPGDTLWPTYIFLGNYSGKARHAAGLCLICSWAL